MVHYRRAHSSNPDAMYFLTYVTKNRLPYFNNRSRMIEQFETWKEILLKCSGELYAYCFLPDHSHILIRQGNISFSQSMRSCKRRLNYNLRVNGTIWQPRFWEHMIKDDGDLKRHVEYIHYNPVKHNLSLSVFDYEYSSFRDFVKKGIYDRTWGENIEIIQAGEPIDLRSPDSPNPGIE